MGKRRGVKESETVQLNVLSVRGTGFPEECLRGSTGDAHRSADAGAEVLPSERLVASCVAVGPAWSQEEPIAQILNFCSRPR